MPRPSLIESVDEVRRWYEDGLTYQQMADLHAELYSIRLSPSAFSNLRRRMGWEGRLLKDHPLIPWKIATRHQRNYILGMLRREARRREGIQTSRSHPLDLVRDWADRSMLRGVIDYDPDTVEGFYYVPRRPGIDTDLIRIP